MWYLDSGCGNHMFGHKVLFTNLDEPVKKVIKFDDGRHINSGDKRDILIVIKDGGKATITEVLYVSSMTSNLISVGQLLAKGFKMKLERNQMKVYRADERLIMKAPLAENKTFKVELNTSDHKCLASTTEEDKNWLWHHKYGHLNFRSLCMINQKRMVFGLHYVKEPKQVCGEC